MQNSGTLQFYKDAEAWTDHVSEAFDFTGTIQALQFCRERKLRDAQIVMRFDWEQYDLILPASADGDERRMVS